MLCFTNIISLSSWPCICMTEPASCTKSVYSIDCTLIRVEMHSVLLLVYQNHNPQWLSHQSFCWSSSTHSVSDKNIGTLAFFSNDAIFCVCIYTVYIQIFIWDNCGIKTSWHIVSVFLFLSRWKKTLVYIRTSFFWN